MSDSSSFIAKGGQVLLGLAAALAVRATARASISYNFATFTGSLYPASNDPLATYGTIVTGVYGNTTVGYYLDGSGIAHGFIYNGSSYMTLDDPAVEGNPNSDGTYLTGIFGNTIIGYYDQGLDNAIGFTYSGSTLAQLPIPPDVFDVRPSGIYGNTIVGNYIDTGTSPAFVGFIYNGSTYTEVSYPGAQSTDIYAVSGSTIVGVYYPNDFNADGFIYDDGVYTTLDDPLAEQYTYLTAIVGTTIYGYSDARDFVATPVPEPAIFALACIGYLVLRRWRPIYDSLD